MNGIILYNLFVKITRFLKQPEEEDYRPNHNAKNLYFQHHIKKTLLIT